MSSVYEIAASTTIGVPPQTVWGVLDDIAGWREWMPSLHQVAVEPLTEGVPRAGYQFRLRGKVVFANMEVIQFTPHERTTRFQMNVPPLRGTNRCVLIPLHGGHYRLKRVDSIILPGPVARFLDRTQRERFENQAEEFLRSLKRAVLRAHEQAQAHTREPSHARAGQ